MPKKKSTNKAAESNILEQLKTAKSVRDLDLSVLPGIEDAVREFNRPRFARGPGGELLQHEEATGGYREIQVGYSYVPGGTKIPSAARKEGAQYGVSRKKIMPVHVDPDAKDGGYVLTPPGQEEDQEDGQEQDEPEEDNSLDDIINDLDRTDSEPEPVMKGAPPPLEAPPPPAPVKKQRKKRETMTKQQEPTIGPPTVQVDFSLKDGSVMSVMYHRVIQNKTTLVCVFDKRYPAAMRFNPAATPAMAVSIPAEQKDYSVSYLKTKFEDGDSEYLVFNLGLKELSQEMQEK